MDCDVTNEEQVKKVFDEVKKVYGKLDFVVHAVAFANKEDLQGAFIDTTRAGWDLALGVSAYSLITVSKYAQPLMTEGGSIFALTYLGSDYVVANYNVMVLQKRLLNQL